MTGEAPPVNVFPEQHRRRPCRRARGKTPTETPAGRGGGGGAERALPLARKPLEQVERFLARAFAFHPVETGVGDVAARGEDFGDEGAAMGGARDADMCAADGAGLGPALGRHSPARIGPEIHGGRHLRPLRPGRGIAIMLLTANPHLVCASLTGAPDIEGRG